MRILIVEDEAVIAQDIQHALMAANYVVCHASDGEEGDFLGLTEDFDAIIMDLGLPGMDGMHVLRNWRREGLTTPVLILTARNHWQDKVEGIDSGGDDYLVKPFEMEELLARLRAIIRRSGGHPSSVLQCGSLQVDVNRGVVSLEHRVIDLSPLEYRAVHCLVFNRGKVVTRSQLMAQVYDPQSEPDSNSLDVLIARIRKKLRPEIIQTRRGQGYIIE